MQYSALGRLESVVNSERALAIYEELGDLERQAIVLNSLGVYAYTQGRWDESVDLYERARTAWDKAGDHWAASFAIANRSEVLLDQGRLDEAEPLFQAALRIARASGSPSRVADITVYLGRVLAGKGEFDAARALITKPASSSPGAETRVRCSRVMPGSPSASSWLAAQRKLCPSPNRPSRLPPLPKARHC